MILAASDSPQLYVPSDQPYAWFTMPMLLWWLTALTVAALVEAGIRLYGLWRDQQDPPAPAPRPRPTPHPRATAKPGRHAHPEDQ